MSEKILEYSQEQYPHPIADTVLGLRRGISSHEKRDRIIEVFRTSIRLLCAYAIGVRAQFGEGPDGASKTFGSLVEGLRRRGLTDGQWVSILREILREYKSKPEAYPIQGMVELFHKKKAKFAKLTNELLDMRKSQTVAHGRVFDEEDLLQIIEERMPQLEAFLEQLKPIFDQFHLSIGNGEEHGKGISILHGLGSTSGSFPTTTATEEVGEEQLCIVNSEQTPVVFLHPSTLFRHPLPELPKEIFVFEKRGKKGAKLLSLPNMYEIEVEESWEPIEQVFFSGEQVDVAPEIEGIDRPFRGLEAFQPKHSVLFFGRNEEAEELTNRIRRNGFVVLTGPSGTGKSSLIQAGVVPQFKAARMRIMRPGNHPLQSLNLTLQKIVSEENKIKLEEAILQGEEDLAADILFRETAKSDQITVLVVDQGEELITLCSDSEKREHFGALLSALGQSSESNMRVVYSLREDFFGPVGVVERIKSIFSRQVMVISTPTQEGLMETLIGPARLFGYQFEDFTLLQEMTQDLENEPAALALLQFCADKMWDRRDRYRKYLTRESYDVLGGVGGALANHAEEIMQSLPPIQQEQVKSIVLRLVTEDKTKQLCSRTELVEGAKNQKAAEQLLNALVKARLLTSRSDSAEGESYYELIHEALITHWRRLENWLLENQEGQRTMLALRQAAFDWEERDRNSSLLWRDDLLEELRHFQRVSTLSLTNLEETFAMACEQAANRSNRIRRMLVSTAFFVITLFSGFSFYQFKQAEQQRNQAVQQRSLAQQSAHKATIGQITSMALLNEAEDKDANALWRSVAQLESKEGFSGITKQNILRNTKKMFSILEKDRSPIGAIDLSPDGRKLVSGTENGVFYLWDLRSGKELLEFTEEYESISALSFSPKGKHVASVSNNFQEFSDIHIWDIDSGDKIHTLEGLKSMAHGMEFSPDGNLIATCSSDRILIWDVKTGTIKHTLRTSEEHKYELNFSYDGRYLAAGVGGAVEIWNVETGQTYKILTGHEDDVRDVEFSPDGKSLASSSFDHTVKIWDFDTGVCIKTLEYRDWSMSLAYSPNGQVLSIGIENDIHRWNTILEREEAPLLGHTQDIRNLIYSVDGTFLISASNDSSIRIWNSAIPHSVKLDGNPSMLSYNSIDHIKFSTDGKTIVTREFDTPEIKVWNTKTGTQLFKLVHDQVPSEMIISPNDKYLASGTFDNEVYLWDLESGLLMHRLTGHNNVILDLQFNFDSTVLLSESGEQNIRLWGVQTGELLFSLQEEQIDEQIQESFPSPKFHPTKNIFIYGLFNESKTVLWDVENNQKLKTFSTNAEELESLTFSPNGDLLVTSDSNGVLMFWNTKSGKKNHTTKPYRFPQNKVLFSPNGKLIAYGTSRAIWQETVFVMDVSSKAVLFELSGHIGRLMHFEFSPDNKFLLTGATNNNFQLWDLETGELVSTIDNIEKTHFLTDEDAFLITDGYSIRTIDLQFTKYSPKRLLIETGKLTNLRVCKDTLDIIPVVPFPSYSSVWANEELCMK